MRRARGKQHRSGRISRGGDHTDALLFRRGDTLLDDSRTAFAAETEARNIDARLQTIIQRRYEVAATRVGRKLANIQLAVRCVTADHVRLVRRGGYEARARRAVAHEILCPGALFAASDIDAVSHAPQLLVAGSNAAVDQGDLDTSAATFSRELIEPHCRCAPVQLVGLATAAPG